MSHPAPTFLEQARAAWFLEQFRSYGCDASIDRAGNVMATLGEPPYVALTAHLDTVLAPRNKDEISVDADGRFRGPGVSDNGAGLAALLAIARACKTSAGCRSPQPACCSSPMWVKRVKATCWACGTSAARLQWPSRFAAT